MATQLVGLTMELGPGRDPARLVRQVGRIQACRVGATQRGIVGDAGMACPVTLGPVVVLSKVEKLGGEVGMRCPGPWGPLLCLARSSNSRRMFRAARRKKSRAVSTGICWRVR